MFMISSNKTANSVGSFPQSLVSFFSLLICTLYFSIKVIMRSVWFEYYHTFLKDFMHQKHIFTFTPLHRPESKNEREVKSNLPQCKIFTIERHANLKKRNAKFVQTSFTKRLCKVNVYFLLQTITQSI